MRRSFAEERMIPLPPKPKFTKEEIDKIELYLDELSEFIGNTTRPDALARCKSLRTLFDNLPKNYRIRAENIL